MAVDVHIVDLFGPVPDGMDLSEDNARHLDEGNLALIAIALLSVILRFGARLVQKAGFRADDYLVLVALLFAVATCVLAGEIVDFGAGKHVWALTSGQVVELTKILYVLAIVYALAVWTLKASIVFLYVRLFPLNDTIFRIGIYTTAAIGTAICLASVVILLTACRPISYFWARYAYDVDDVDQDGTTEGQCIHIGTMFIGFASVNVMLDFFLLAIPIPRILRLQMTVRKKLIVITSLFLGVLVCVAGLMRIYYLILFNDSNDYSWTLAPVCMWLAMEPAIGVVTACLPNILPLYYWCCERAGFPRGGGGGGGGEHTRHGGPHHNITSRSGVHRSKVYHGGDVGQRLPTYIENNMMLRPKEDDEICLTTMATAARNVSSESVEVLGHGILVRSEVTQTIESGELRKVTSL